MPHKKRLLRIAVAHFKKPEITESQFHRWVVEEHCPKVARLHAKHGIVGYEMIFSPKSAREMAQKLNVHLHGRWEIDEHDVQVVFYVRALEHLTAVLADPEFVALQEEEAPFVGTSGIIASLGWVEAYVQDGRVVNLDAGGKTQYARFDVQSDFSAEKLA